jgi:hypothetical protein
LSSTSTRRSGSCQLLTARLIRLGDDVGHEDLRRRVRDGDGELGQPDLAVVGSVAVHNTGFSPIWKIEPEAGAQVTATGAPKRSSR